MYSQSKLSSGLHFTKKGYDLTDAGAIAARAEWLKALPQTVVTELIERSATLTTPEGTLIYDLEDETGGIFALLDGIVGIRTDNQEMETVFGHLMGPGSWFGEMSFLSGGPRAVGAVALTRCQILYVKPQSLADLAAAEPMLWRALALLTATNSRIAYRVARDVMIKTPRERLLAVLERLQDGIGADQPIPLSQEQLADMCALSRGATSKFLRQLVSERLVDCGYRQIRLIK